MNEEFNSEIKSFYNSSDLYFNICENRTESSFINVIDVINQYIPKNAKLLEFGCGTGNLAHLIAKCGYTVLGVDVSERFINYAMKVYAAETLSLTFQTVDFGTLPFNDNCYDCIYTCAVLEHCYEVDKILLDIDRLLKPGGYLIIATPNLLSPFTRLSLILKRIVGKRKRFHLYGSPMFFMKSIWYSFKKALSKKPNLIYVNPKYEGFNESDEDVTFLSNHFDYLKLLKPLHYKILELSRGDSKSGKLISKVFPKLSGEVLIVSKKGSIT